MLGSCRISCQRPPPNKMQRLHNMILRLCSHLYMLHGSAFAYLSQVSIAMWMLIHMPEHIAQHFMILYRSCHLKLHGSHRNVVFKHSFTMHIATWAHWFCDRCHDLHFDHFDLHFDHVYVLTIGFAIDFALGSRERFFFRD